LLAFAFLEMLEIFARQRSTLWFAQRCSLRAVDGNDCPRLLRRRGGQAVIPSKDGRPRPRFAIPSVTQTPGLAAPGTRWCVACATVRWTQRHRPPRMKLWQLDAVPHLLLVKW